jgi:hypothetical protein
LTTGLKVRCAMMGYAAADHQPVEDQPHYTIAELVEIRRQVLRYARSMPPGSDRNHHGQVALSLRSLFRNTPWLDAHTIDGSQ